MGDENPIRTLGDYSRPRHEGYKNTIELPKGNNVVPLRSDTIWLVQNECLFHGLRSKDPNQHLKDFLKLVDLLDLDIANRERMRLRLFQFYLRDQASNWLERLPAGSISTWEDLTTRFLAQFSLSGRTAKLHHVNPVTRRTIDQSANGKLRDRNTEESWALLEDPTLYDNKSWNDPRDFAKAVKAISLPQDIPMNKITSSCEIYSGPHDTQYCIENPEQSFVDYASSRTDEAGGDDGDMIFIEIMKKNDDSHKEEPEVEGCPLNFKIPCNIGHVHIEKAYIDLNSPLNIMTRMLYNWIMRRKLDPRENTNEGVNNFTSRIKGKHVFVENFTYVIDFMIVEDISSIIDPRLSQVVLGKPFVEISNMNHDPPKGIVRFTNETDKIAYKMPHKIEQYNLLSDLEREHTKLVYLRNKEDKRRGVEYVMSKILGFYKECLELGPEYATGIADEGEVTIVHTERGDVVAGFKRRRQDFQGDGVMDLTTTSGRSQLKAALEDSTWGRDENPIRTLGDYSRPSHEGYRNTIELPEGNNAVPLRSDTKPVVRKRMLIPWTSLRGTNQHLKDFLKVVDSLDLDVANKERTRLHLSQFSLRDQASNWLERLPAGSISTWEDLTTRFLT
ncbi:MAK10-like protein [Tanacetum coccineum]